MNKWMLYIAFLSLGTNHTFSQQIAIDKGIKAGNMWCFPLVNDSLSYYYLPSNAQLANENGLPKFSMLRYVMNQQTESNHAINEAGGGAVLHFLVQYDTPKEVFRKAEKILQQKVGEKAILKGSVVFKKAKYALISSTLNHQKKMLGSGEAPVLENSSMAFSFELSPKDSEILIESFKTGTSDISIVFDFTFEGFSDAFEAQLEVDWAKTYQFSEKTKQKKVFFVGSEIKETIDEMLRNEAIKLTKVGSNQKMENLIERVYNKIIDLLYEPIKTEAIKTKKTNLIDEILGESIAKEISGLKQLLPFSINSAYQLKSIRNEGHVSYDFKEKANIERHHFLTFNIGDIYTKFGTNPLIFNEVNLNDATFLQRNIAINIDGEVAKDLDKMVNNLIITLRKIHQDSTETIKEIIIDKKAIQSPEMIATNYLNQGDTDRLKWLEYEYQLAWQLVGGGTIKTDWIKDDSPILNVYLPYKRWKIGFGGDWKKLESFDIKLINFQVNYELNKQAKSERINFVLNENLENKILEITIPTNQEEVSYTLNWIKKDGSRLSQSGKDRYGFILIDNLPINR